MNVKHIADLEPNNSTVFFSLFILIIIFLGISTIGFAQYKFVTTHEDSLALKNVIVEKYYIADSSDYSDTTGGVVPIGSLTYRIYIEMKPGYTLQMVYGEKAHPLVIKTTTFFFNNQYCQAVTGFNINPKDINRNTVALDSWITMAAATKLHSGVLKSEDNDGSIIKRKNLSKEDGLLTGEFPTLKAFNLDLNFFKDRRDASLFMTNNGGWAALGGGGAKGPTQSNRVLIAQLTTNGILSFKLNIQIGTPSHGWIKYVPSSAGLGEIQFKALAY